MGVYIRGMEMPTSCRDCGIEQEWFWCGALDGYQNTRCFTNERREDCPLVPVPPHGRLIDADVLQTDYFVPSTASGMPNYYYVSKKQIDEAQTIIPAEEGE